MDAADTCFVTPFGTFDLQRYPARPREPLQAWCAADGLLLEAAAELDEPSRASIVVVNDDHGALALPLSAQSLWTDSALSARATADNCRRNERPQPTVTWSLDTPPPASLLVMRVPKQLEFFSDQLTRIAASQHPGTRLLVGGMDKHLSPHTANLIEQYIGPTERHRGQRKARIFSAQVSAEAKAHGHREADRWRAYLCQPLAAELRALPNTFSGDRLDGGSALLLATLGKLPPVTRLTDLACGNGVLGLAALSQGLAGGVLFCDESAMAVASARANAQRLFPDHMDALQFHHGDGLLDVEPATADLILCNPPFHLQHTVDEYAGRRLLSQAARHLTDGGQLCLVANRHLRYLPLLQRTFHKVEHIADDRRFSVWLASRPKR
ncbi:class I SAM-dependent methyltransferase [Parahaliea aestuarii]|uniref:Methyltransferase n=1 Tax=Parahaliea aestuarii TaxID=1852021 RepID=A0A5C8ZUB4_9GAMM|nr:methyltransferase [Parahaliea aestuarii]TXS91152.1 methyltransferase [Parahaliea aestuarii]